MAEAPPSDRTSRELLIGRQTMRNEHIDTTGRGQVQLLFADQSSLSIAPGSDVVIERFDYDPQNQTGELVVTMTAGLLRYVGGSISKQREVAFVTPGATVSLRGGIILIRVAGEPRPQKPDGSEIEALFLSGERMCVAAGAQNQCTSEFATGITVVRGGTPTVPHPVTAERLQMLLGALQVGASNEAGAPAVPPSPTSPASTSAPPGATPPR